MTAPVVHCHLDLSHARADRETVIAEIESADFQLLDQSPIPGLEENYALRFRRL